MLRESPDLTFQVGALGGMSLEDWSENAKLEPAGVYLRVREPLVVFLLHVSADVVAPVAVAHVGGGSGEIREELEDAPLVVRITGEAKLVAVAAKASPAVVDKRTLRSVALLIGKEGVVDPEGVAEAFHILGFYPLLPVKPPEIYALALQGADYAVEIGIGPFLLGHAVRDAGLVAGLTHGSLVSGIEVAAIVKDIVLGAVVVGGAGEIIGNEGGVAFLEGADAGGGVQVQGGLVAHAVQVSQKTLRIREKVPVPGVAGPSAALVKIVMAKALAHILIGIVPVHVNYHDVHGDIVLLHLAAKGQEFIVREDPVAAPPVAKRPLGRHGDAAGDLHEVPQGGRVVVSVGEEVPVQAVAFRPFSHPAIGPEKMAGRFIHHRPSVPGDDAVFQF